VKKVLIGVGIGCGGLLLLALIAVVAGGFWVKGKVEGVAEEMAQDAEKAKQQEQRAAELDKKYAFDAPPKGQPVRLTEARLQDYFAVRAALKPALTELEEKSKKFQQAEGQPAEIAQAFKAFGAVTGMVAEVRRRWVDALEKQKMSPREFHAITAAVYGSHMGDAMGKARQGQREMLEQLAAGLKEQVKDERLPAELREQMRQQLAQVQKQIAALPPPDAVPSDVQKIYTANLALLERYKQQLEQDSTQGLDLILIGGGEELDRAFQDVMGDHGLAPDEQFMDDESPVDEGESE
jgi:hypothetical protein